MLGCSGYSWSSRSSCWMFVSYYDAVQAQGDVLGQLHDDIYRDFGLISVFAGVGSHTLPGSTGSSWLLRTSDV